MLQSETPSLHKTNTTKSEPKQSLIMADLKPGLACNFSIWKLNAMSRKGIYKRGTVLLPTINLIIIVNFNFHLSVTTCALIKVNL